MAKTSTWRNRIVGHGEQPERRQFKPSHVVYALIDPRDGLPHYIGLTRDVRYRFYRHMRDKETNAVKVAWIDDLGASGLMPGVRILAEVDAADVADVEIYWIAKGREMGWPLTNATDGGEGVNDNSAKPPAFDYLSAFLSESAWRAFCSLPVTQRFEVCRITALMALDNSCVIARALGHEWRGISAQADVAVETAERAVSAAGIGALGAMEADIMERHNALAPALAAYQSRLLAQ